MGAVFVVNIYRDAHLALRLGQQLREHFSKTPVLFIGDGFDVPRKLKRYGDIYQGSRLKQKTTGEWTARYLTLGLEYWIDTIIKLDPDTCVWRHCEIPDLDWFGTLSNNHLFVRGGACGFSRRVATRLLARLKKDRGFTYDRYDRFRWPHETVAARVSCQDRIVGATMKEMGIAPSAWPEANILGNENEIALQGDFAISHPHPVLESAFENPILGNPGR